MNDPLEAVKLDPVVVDPLEETNPGEVGLDINTGEVGLEMGELLNTTPGGGRKLGFEGEGPKILGGGGRCGRGGDGTWADPPPLFLRSQPAGDSLPPPTL